MMDQIDELIRDLQKTAWKRNAEDIMRTVDELISGYGVESIRIPDADIDRFHGDHVASYVNTGDSYTPTIAHDHESGEFLLTTYADLVEIMEDKYGRFD